MNVLLADLGAISGRARGVSARHRRIGMELRRLRSEKGMTLTHGSAFLGRPKAWLCTVETGTRPIRPWELEYILFKYGHTEGPFWTAMMELIHDGRKSGWWSRYADILPAEYLDFLSLEDGAKRVRGYAVDVVPGLFQTPEYATCLSGVGGDEIDARLLEMWTTRQQVLDRADPPQCDLILTEAVLRHQMGGPEIMRAQLRHLIDLSARNHVHLQVIPFTAGPHRGLAKPFTLLNVGRQGNLTITALESRIGLDFEERDDKVRLFEEIFADLQIIALPEDETRSFIKRLSSEP